MESEVNKLPKGKRKYGVGWPEAKSTSGSTLNEKRTTHILSAHQDSYKPSGNESGRTERAQKITMNILLDEYRMIVQDASRASNHAKNEKNDRKQRARISSIEQDNECWSKGACGRDRHNEVDR